MYKPERVGTFSKKAKETWEVVVGVGGVSGWQSRAHVCVCVNQQVCDKPMNSRSLASGLEPAKCVSKKGAVQSVGNS